VTVLGEIGKEKYRVTPDLTLRLDANWPVVDFSVNLKSL
jgi:hypothetical protein